MNQHKSTHIAPRSPEGKQQRISRTKDHQQFRYDKLERTRYEGARRDVELANSLRLLGIDYFSQSRGQALRLVPKIWNGRRVDEIPENAFPFLLENFVVGKVFDSEGRAILRFIDPEEEKMKLHTIIAEASEQPRKVVKVVLETLEKQIYTSLKEDRRIRIPGIGIFSVKYRKARPKRKGINPFTKKPHVFQAKPASNKLRFSPAKDLKKYVSDKLKVVAPKKKKGKK